jgi:chaperonin GroEL (HSP60 family)
MGLADYAGTIGGREQMAIESFANAIEAIPRALANNAGMDAIDMLIKLRQAHKRGKKYYGIDVKNADIGDMRAENILEPAIVGTQAIRSATEGAVMILRIDDVIAAKETGAGAGMPPGGMGGMGGMPPEM